MKGLNNIILFFMVVVFSLPTIGGEQNKTIVFKENKSIIYKPMACDVPTSLTATGITSTEATLGCAVVSGATNYQFSYKITGGTWVTVGSTTNSKLITGLTPASDYQYRVKAICPSGSSAFSASSSFTTQGSACGVPANPTTTNITTSSATFNWTAVSGASAYKVQYRQKNTDGSWPATWVTVTPNPTNPTHTANGLTENRDHQWHVKAICGANEGDYSSLILFTTQSACGAPTNLSSSNITTTSVNLSWTAGNGAISYNLEYKKVSDPNWILINTPNTSYSLTGLDVNTSYTYKVCTNCAGGIVACSATPNPTFQTLSLTCDPPIADSNNTTNITTNSARFNWWPVAGVVGYKVKYRQKNTNGTWPTNWTEPNTTITAIFYDVSGLAEDRDQQWQVKSVCANNVESAWDPIKNYSTLACTSPTNTTTTNITTTSAKFNWNIVPGAISYSIRYRAKNPDGSWPSTWTDVPTPVTTLFYDATGLVSDKDHQWQVKSNCTATLSSGWSASELFHTLGLVCNPPTGLTTTGITSSSATLNWVVNPSASSYKIQYREKQPNGSWGTWQEFTAGSNFYNLTGLNADKDYQWQVRSVCSPTLESAWTTPITAFSTTLGCSFPGGIDAISNSTDAFTITWNAVPNAYGYHIRYKLSTEPNWTNFGSVNHPSNSFIATGLTAGATYNYQVSTICAIGDTTSFSVTGTIIVNTPCNETPPIYLSELNVTANEATLTWTQMFGAQQYIYQYRLSSDPNWANGFTGTSPTNSVSIANLQPNTNYTWRVKSVCGGGLESDYSNIREFKTNSACNFPNNLSVTDITTTSVILNWSNINSAIKYLVQVTTNPAVWPTTFITTTTNSYLLNGLIINTTYYFRVKTVCEGNDTSTLFSPHFQFATAPYNCVPPVELTTNNISSTKATFKWLKQPKPPTASYYVCYKKVSETTWNCDTVQNISAGTGGVILDPLPDSSGRMGLPPLPPVEYMSATASGLMPSTDYVWKVKSICSNGSESPFSSLIPFTTDGLCKIPNGLMVSNITATATTLKWNIPAGSDVSLFRIQYRVVGATSWINRFAAGTKDTLRITTLLANTNYEFKILSQCTSPDVSDYSSPPFPWKTLTPCNFVAPTNLTSSQITSTSVLLEWSWFGDNTNGYELSYKEAGAMDFIVITQMDNWKTLTGLMPNTNYVWKVRRVCATGFGPMSSPLATFKTNEECKLPNDITGVSNSLGTALITWAISNQSGISYNFRYRKVGDPNWINSTQSTNTVNLSGLTWGATYEYQVQTICGPNDLSVWSPVKTVTIKDNCTLNGPGGLTESAITYDGATLSWTAVNPSFGIIKYRIKIRKESDPANGGQEYEVAAPTNTFVISGLETGVKYCWRVKAICNSGESEYGNTSCFTPLLCEVPQQIESWSNSLDGATFFWQAVPGALSYELNYSTSPDGPWTIVTSTTTTIVLTGLTSGTTYYFRVRTLCSNFNIGSWSSTMSVTIKTTCNLLPPTHPRNKNIQLTSAGLRWNFNEFGDSPIQSWDSWECFWNGMFCNLCIPCIVGFNIGNDIPPGVINYTIQYRKESDSGTPWSLQVTSSTNTVTLTNLAPCTRYHWRVRANCPTGSSDWSENRDLVTACGLQGGDGDGKCTKIESVVATPKENSITDINTKTTISWLPRDASVVTQYYTKLREKIKPSGTDGGTGDGGGTDDGEYGTAINGSIEGGINSIELSNLKFDQEYRFEIITECIPSDVIEGETLSEPTIIDFRTNPEKSIYEKSSGSNKVTTLQNMKIVPNPTRGIFDVRFETTEESNVTLRIFDLTGKTIAYEEFTTSTGINTKQFNLEGISKGIYFVDMINNGIKTTSKVVIAE